MEESAPSELVWSREQVRNLVDLYRDRPLLWDHTSDLYKDKSKKHCAWQEIAQAMKMTKLEVQTKMRILMIQFKRESKKLESCSVPDYGRSKWFAYDSLLFLKDRSNPRHCRENIPAENITIDEDNVTKDLPEIEVRSVPVTIKRARPAASPDTMYPPSAERPTKRWYSPVAEEAFSVGKNVQYKDEYDIFGELVACQLRKCTDLRERAIAKQRINQVLFDLEMSSWNNPSSHSTSPSTSRCSDAFG